MEGGFEGVEVNALVEVRAVRQASMRGLLVGRGVWGYTPIVAERAYPGPPTPAGSGHGHLSGGGQVVRRVTRPGASPAS